MEERESRAKQLQLTTLVTSVLSEEEGRAEPRVGGVQSARPQPRAHTRAQAGAAGGHGPSHEQSVPGGELLRQARM